MKLGEREKRLLGGLGVALAAVLLVRAIGGGDAELGDLGGGRGDRAARGGEEPAVRTVVDLDVAKLAPRAGASFEIGRDPFRYGQPPAPPPPPPTPPPTPRPVVVEVVPQTPPPPPVPTPPPSDHLRFLGTFGPPQARIAVVLSGGELHNVRQGAVLEGKFIVEEIGYESVAIGFVGFPDAPPRRLPVGGQ